MSDPIISRNRDGSIDHSGNSRFGYLAGHHEKSTLQAKLAARSATRERERHRDTAAQLVRDGLDDGDEAKLSDGLLMRARTVELADGGHHAGHYAYTLKGNRLIMATFGLTAVEAIHAAEVHARLLGQAEPDGPDPNSLAVLKVRDAAMASEVVQSMELLGWLRRHIDSPLWAGVGPLSDLEDLFEPVALPDA